MVTHCGKIYDMDFFADFMENTPVKIGQHCQTYERMYSGTVFTEARCNVTFKVIRSNTEITITPARIARLRSNLVYRVSSRHRRYVARHVQGSGVRRILLWGSARPEGPCGPCC